MIKWLKRLLGKGDLHIPSKANRQADISLPPGPVQEQARADADSLKTGDFSVTRPGQGFIENMAEVESGLFYRVTTKAKHQTRAIERLLKGDYGMVLITDRSAIRLAGLAKRFGNMPEWEVSGLYRTDPNFDSQVRNLSSAIVSDPFQTRLILFQGLTAGYDVFQVPSGARLVRNSNDALCAFLQDRPIPRVALVMLDPAHVSRIKATAGRIAYNCEIRARLPGDAYHIVNVELNIGKGTIGKGAPIIPTEYKQRLLAVADERQRGQALYDLEHEWASQW